MHLKHPEISPTVYPLPFLVAVLALYSVVGRRRRAALAAGLLPHLAFSRWSREAARTGQAELLAYPYLQLAQEAWSDVGFAEEWLRSRGSF
jgi:hypothetical protein